MDIFGFQAVKQIEERKPEGDDQLREKGASGRGGPHDRRRGPASAAGRGRTGGRCWRQGGVGRRGALRAPTAGPRHPAQAGGVASALARQGHERDPTAIGGAGGGGRQRQGV